MRISDWSSDVCSSDLLGKRRLRLHDLADHPAVFPDENTYTRRIVTQALQQHDLTPRIRLTTNYLETLKMLVGIGLGWSVLPDSVIDDSIRRLPVPEQIGRASCRERVCQYG